MNARMNCTMGIFCHDEWQAYSAADHLLFRLLNRMRHLSFVDNFICCTNVDRLAPTIKDTGFRHIPIGLPPNRKRELPSEFRKALSTQLHRQIGSVGNIQLSLDAAHLLVETQTLEEMFDHLMENSDCHEVALGYCIDPHIYIKFNGALHQIYDHPGMDRQKMPKLYRKVCVSIRHGLRMPLGPKKTQILAVPWSQVMAYDPNYHGFFQEQASDMEKPS